jgi:hypothetical protein
MAGFLGFAPIYVNGLLAIFFVFVLPGLVLVRAFDIPDVPQRWLVIVLSSLTATHLLVTLIAALHLPPLLTFRVAAAALIAAMLFMTTRKSKIAGPPVQPGASICLALDVRWFACSLLVLGFAYWNIWKYGVPNVFPGSDVSGSWNAWALIWSNGSFPIHSWGYSQFVPTTWATTYIFTGSTVQYFPHYTYVVLIIVPIVLCVAILGRMNWRYATSLLFVFAWFIVEVKEGWLKSTLQEGWPDWIAAIFAFCGVVLFIANGADGRYDRQNGIIALISLWLLSIAAATKIHYGLFAAVILIKLYVDTSKYLQRIERTRLMVVAAVLASIFAAAYIVYFLHLEIRQLPVYPHQMSLTEKLSHAFALFNSNFSLPFRILVVAGLAASPFVKGIRWLALPLMVGFLSWASLFSYDLRNLLGMLLISAVIPFFAVFLRFAATGVISGKPGWELRDGFVAAGMAVLCVVLTLPLAMGDEKLKQRFDDDQLRKGLGIELTGPMAQLLVRGCTVFMADGYVLTVSALQPFRERMIFYHSPDPLSDRMEKMLNELTGCLGILYRINNTHASIQKYIDKFADSRGDRKIIEHNGYGLLVLPPEPPRLQ